MIRTNAYFFPIVLLLYFFINAANGKIIYVNDSADGKDNGLSWSNAYKGLQDALADSIKGDEIWVAAGIYVPAAVNGDRHISFELVDGVALYGGFMGNENSREERDYVKNSTILSGNLSEVDNPPTTQKSNHVLICQNVESGTILDGFTITDGHAEERSGGGMLTYPPFPHLVGSGGGMLIYKSSPKVVNCIFIGNFAKFDGAAICNEQQSSPMLENCEFGYNYAIQGGAAIANRNMSSPGIVNCIFRENNASTGGGIFNLTSSPTVKGCDFLGNNAGSGGGIFNNGHSSPIIEDCNFTLNSAINGGGIFTLNSPNNGAENSMMIVACTFTDNHASGNGGGIYNQSSSPAISNSQFQYNSAGSGGGGIYNIAYSSPAIVNCEFINNSAGIMGGGGIFMELCSDPLISRCHFTGNISNGSGGALRIIHSGPKLFNCIFTRNIASLYGGGSIAIELISGVRIVNCTIANNTVQHGSGGGILFNIGDKVRIVNSIIWGNHPENIAGISSEQSQNIFKSCNFAEQEFGGDDTIRENPALTADGHLSGISPCIDAGSDISLEVLDLEEQKICAAVPYDGLISLPDIDGELYVGVGQRDIGADEFIDVDNDMLPDWLEKQISQTVTGLTSKSDPDKDDLSTLIEYKLSTNPINPDTDLDGRWDGEEALVNKTNEDITLISDPRHPDTIIAPYNPGLRFSIPAAVVTAFTQSSVVIDIDDDNDTDALIGLNNGTIVLSLNTGTEFNPQWAEPVEVYNAANMPYDGTINTGSSTYRRGSASPKFTVGDINADSVLEIIVCFQNQIFVSNPISEMINPKTSQSSYEPIIDLPDILAMAPRIIVVDLVNADGDFMKDGFNDIVLIHENNEMTLVRNNGMTGSISMSPPDSIWAGTSQYLSTIGSFADIDLDGDLDRFIGGDGLGLFPFFQINEKDHPLVLPRNPTLIQGENQPFLVENFIRFEIIHNESGASIDQDNVYTAGTQAVGIDVLRAVDDFGNSTLVVINVISDEDANRSAKVLIAVGTRSLTDSLYPTSERLAKDAYIACLQRGYRKSDIFLLTPNGQLLESDHLGYTISANGSNANLKDAVVTWAADVNDLVLYFVDHGVVRESTPDRIPLGNLVLNPGNYLASTTIKTWLDEWQEGSNKASMVIVDTCYSGHFIEEIQGTPETPQQNRIVIASSKPDQLAHFQSNGNISFSQIFWDEIAAGAETKTAFLRTVDELNAALNQNPVIDVNGDGKTDAPNNVTGIKNLGLADILATTDRPHIEDWMDDQEIDNESAVLWCANVSSKHPVTHVNAFIVLPSLDTEVEGGSALTTMPKIELQDFVARRRIEAADFQNWQNESGQLDFSEKSLLNKSYSQSGDYYELKNDVEDKDKLLLRQILEIKGYSPRYEGTWNGFKTPGTYRILFFAEDSYEKLSPAKTANITLTGPTSIALITEFHGNPVTEDLWNSESISEQAWLANQSLIKRSYTSDTIRWIGGESGISKNDIRTAITDNTVSDIGAMVIYLIGNGSSAGLFLSDNTVLEPGDLKYWLDMLQTTHSDSEVTIIVEADFSGIFMSGLADPRFNRTIISSTNSQTQTLRYGGLTFGRWFWRNIVRGHSIQRAFANSLAIAHASGFLPYFSIDDDGNGIFEPKKDGFNTLNKYIGALFLTGDDTIGIGKVSEIISLSAVEGERALLWIEDTFSPDGTELEVLATIIDIDKNEIISPLPIVFNPKSPGRYEREITSTDFPYPGQFRALIQVRSKANPTLDAIPSTIDIYYDKEKSEQSHVVKNHYPRLTANEKLTSQPLDFPNGNIFRIWVEQEQRYSIDLFPVSSDHSDLQLSIMEDPSNNDLILVDADYWGVGMPEQIWSWQPNYSGWYFVRVNASEPTTSVSIKLVKERLATADGYESDDFLTQAKWITWLGNDFQEHNFHQQGDEDWLFFYALSEHSYKVEVYDEAINCDVAMELFKQSDNVIFPLPEITKNETSGDGEIIQILPQDDAVFYYLRLLHDNPSIAGLATNYKVRIIDETGFPSVTLMVLVYEKSDSGIKLIEADISAPGIDHFDLTDGIYIQDVSAGIYDITVTASSFQPESLVKTVAIDSNEDFKEVHFFYLQPDIACVPVTSRINGVPAGNLVINENPGYCSWFVTSPWPGVDGENGVRYIANSSAGNISVDSTETVIVNWQKQVFLDLKRYGDGVVNSNRPAGWMAENITVNLSATPVNSDTHRFSRWQGDLDDSPIPNENARSESTVSISMNGAKIIMAIFELNPELALNSDRITLNNGWNLISLPCIPEDSRPDVLFQNSVIGQTWTWSDGNFSKVQTLNPMTGYWAYCNKNTSVDIEGVHFVTTDRILGSGWNLFGPTADSPLPENDHINGTFWHWINGQFTAAKSLQKGRGYWIKVDNTATIEFNDIQQ